MLRQFVETPGFAIRTMRPDEIPLAVDWAAAEGWNPGLQDASCFGKVDGEGFFVGEFEQQPAAIISMVNYDRSFSFLGFYIVRKDLRGRGLGMEIWRRALHHAGSRAIGLDGVVAQQDNYRKSGFELSHRNIRFGGRVSSPMKVSADIQSLERVSFAEILADDATVFPAPRDNFLRRWIACPGHHALGLRIDGRLAAWGVIRPCRIGHKIGPLVADDAESAEAVFQALLHAAKAEQVFIDTPEPNELAMALAEACGLAPMFETARMYRGPTPILRLDRLFGVTTFELG